jgi:hypothetical protein
MSGLELFWMLRVTSTSRGNGKSHYRIYCKNDRLMPIYLVHR